MGKHTIDIILPTYNGDKYLDELINSILKQSYKDFKFIIRDDGSKDDTKSILDKYKRKYPDKFTIIEDCLGNLGAVSNFFEIMKYSTSQYIMLCDQDDVWFRNKVLILLNYIRKKEMENPNLPILVHSEAVVVNEHLEVLDNSFGHYSHLDRKHCHISNLLHRNVVQGSAMIFNKALLDKLWKVSEDACKKNGIKKYVYHDFWIAILASLYGHIYFYRKPLMYYRQHSNNVVGAQRYDVTIFNLFKDNNWDRMKSNNYLIINRELCKVILKNYENDLNSTLVRIIEHYRDNPYDFKEFFHLKLYKYFTLKEVLLMLIFCES